MQVDTQLIPFTPDPGHLTNRSVVVIDVLRATSVMIHALSRGASEVIPVKTIDDAFRHSRLFPPGSALLGGEKQSRKIEGFDLGNSPREYMAEAVKNKRIILMTTNGTKAFHSVSEGKEVIAASFFNIGAAANRCVEKDHDLLIFPSGNKGGFSLEDTVCAGMLIDRIRDRMGDRLILTDASLAAHVLYRRFESDLTEAFHLSEHGRDLVRLGFEDDLAYCAQTDIFPLVPVFLDGVIKAQ